MSHTPEQNFLRYTTDVWQRYYSHPLHREEAREMANTLTQFMDTLCQWDQRDQEKGNHVSRLRYNTMYVTKILQRIEKMALAGANFESWRYLLLIERATIQQKRLQLLTHAICRASVNSAPNSQAVENEYCHVRHQR